MGDDFTLDCVPERSDAFGCTSLFRPLPLGTTLPLSFDLDLVSGDCGEEVGTESTGGSGAIDVGPLGEGQQDLVTLCGLDDPHAVDTVAL